MSDRRADMVQALIDLIAAGGIEAATVRKVAAGSGVSIGAVQHHFPTKAAMLAAAAEEMFARTAQRATALDGLDDVGRLRALARVLVPGDSEDALARVWLSLATLAVFDQTAGDVYRRRWAGVRAEVGRLMAAVRPGDQAESAAELLALCDGLALAVLAEPSEVEPELARQTVSRWLDRWLDAVD